MVRILSVLDASTVECLARRQTPGLGWGQMTRVLELLIA
jgi:hypothetical protein